MKVPGQPPVVKARSTLPQTSITVIRHKSQSTKYIFQYKESELIGTESFSGNTWRPQGNCPTYPLLNVALHNTECQWRLQCSQSDCGRVRIWRSLCGSKSVLHRLESTCCRLDKWARGVRRLVLEHNQHKHL